MVILLHAEKGFWENLTPIHDNKKNLGENGDTRDIAQHNKGNIQKTQSQYRVKQAATQSISVKNQEWDKDFPSHCSCST